jgi:hypothetical protein
VNVYDARLLASPSCLYVCAITDNTAIKIGKSATNPVQR